MSIPYHRLAVTPGEPAGIGPDVCLAAAFHQHPAEIVLIADKNMLQQRATALQLNIELYDFDASSPQINGHGRIAVCHEPLIRPCIPKQLNPANAAYVLNTLHTAHALCSQKITSALVTGPVHKALINQAGIPFSGHTEYLAQLCDKPEPLMTFYSPDCIVGLATTHIPLQEVPKALDAFKLKQIIHKFHRGLQEQYQLSNPKIAILGLNPHAGEQGLLGTAETEWMIPLIAECQKNNINIHGPIPGDTAFTPNNRQTFDAFLAMYHDQGLAPIKALYFEQLVNITIGLTYLRTSVDHGTALDIAATGKARESSLMLALATSLKLLA
jgi:4-hydroxythreonine-4-phosphate dehydrogenase